MKEELYLVTVKVCGVFSDPAIHDCALQDHAQNLDKLVDRGRGQIFLEVQFNDPRVELPGGDVSKFPLAPGGQDMVAGVAFAYVQIPVTDRPPVSGSVCSENRITFPGSKVMFSRWSLLSVSVFSHHRTASVLAGGGSGGVAAVLVAELGVKNPTILFSRWPKVDGVGAFRAFHVDAPRSL